MLEKQVEKIQNTHNPITLSTVDNIGTYLIPKAVNIATAHDFQS